MHPSWPDPKLHQHTGSLLPAGGSRYSPRQPTGHTSKVTGRTAKAKSTADFQRGNRSLCCAAQSGFRTSSASHDVVIRDSAVTFQTHLVGAVREVHPCNVHPSLDHLLGHFHRSGSRSCWTHGQNVKHVRASLPVCVARDNGRKPNISIFYGIIIVDLLQLGAFPVCFFLFGVAIYFLGGLLFYDVSSYCGAAKWTSNKLSKESIV